MKNVVLIALVVLVILFVVHQYDPSFFGIFGSREGFADVMKANGAIPSGNAHGNLKAGQMASNGKAQMGQNGGAASVNQGGRGLNSPATMATPYTSETPLKAGAGVQGSKPSEGFADLSAYEGPAGPTSEP